MSWNSNNSSGTRWGSSSGSGTSWGSNTGWGGQQPQQSQGYAGYPPPPPTAPPPPPPSTTGWGGTTGNSAYGSAYGGSRSGWGTSQSTAPARTSYASQPPPPARGGAWQRGQTVGSTMKSSSGGTGAWGTKNRRAVQSKYSLSDKTRQGSNHNQSTERRRDRSESPRRNRKSRSRDRGRRKRSRSRDRSKGKREDDSEKHSIFAELLGLSGKGKDRGKSPSPEKPPEPPKASLDEKARQKRMRVKLEKLCTTVTIKPKNKAPPPIEAFKDQKTLPKVLLENLEKEKFSVPTPVQKYSVPVLMAKMDCMVCATTGSGKTMAFLIPLVANLLNEDEVLRPFFPGKNACASPLVLILAPTRELCIQIDEQVYIVTKETWVSSFAIFGGDNYAQQSSQVGKRQIDILSATPGRLVDMIDCCKISFQFIKCLAFDEADNMLELGFEKAITDIVTGRDMPPREKRQTVMFSATFPKSIQELAKKFLRDEYIFIRLGETGRTTKMITQRIKWVEPRNRNMTLLHDLSMTTNKVIVFVSRRQHADKVANFLQGKGINAGSLHGNQDQDTREESICKFKDDAFRVLCATDVAARGLDFPEIELVINFDMPQNLEVYTHRIGRTGRIGTAGTALSYFGPTNQNLSSQLADYLRDSKQEVPTWLQNMASARGPRRSWNSTRQSNRSSWPRGRQGGRSNQGSAPPRWHGA